MHIRQLYYLYVDTEQMLKQKQREFEEELQTLKKKILEMSIVKEIKGEFLPTMLRSEVNNKIFFVLEVENYFISSI